MSFVSHLHASRNSGLLYILQTAWTQRMFSMLTGCPPQELFVNVNITKGTSAALS